MTTLEIPSRRLSPADLDGELRQMLAGEKRTVKTALDLLLEQAVLRRASDIHFEPYRGRMRIRLRVDGYFQDVVQLPAEVHEQVISRVKVMAGLVVHRRDIVQEGRIHSGGADYRISIIPTVAGEKLAIRIFDSGKRVMEIEDLGFMPDMLGRFEDILLRLSGTVLLTGPSGTGKTTTLYAGLRRIHDKCGDHAGITTIEDPVEYDLGLFAQIQVDARSELTFEKALTAVLRQDPKVIMMGEIRRPSTCEIAMRAGLTGHLVLSTIHSGTACGVVTRLLDMGIEPYVLSSSLKAVLAQRLVRKICADCAEPYDPDPALLAFLQGTDQRYQGPYLKGLGCENCLGAGYQGRIALAELLEVDETLARHVAGKVTTRYLEEAARENGFRNMLHDGIRKVRAGRTTIEEVLRTLGMEARP